MRLAFPSNLNCGVGLRDIRGNFKPLSTCEIHARYFASPASRQIMN